MFEEDTKHYVLVSAHYWVSLTQLTKSLICFDVRMFSYNGILIEKIRIENFKTAKPVNKRQKKAFVCELLYIRMFLYTIVFCFVRKNSTWSKFQN